MHLLHGELLTPHLRKLLVQSGPQKPQTLGVGSNQNASSYSIALDAMPLGRKHLEHFLADVLQLERVVGLHW